VPDASGMRSGNDLVEPLPTDLPDDHTGLEERYEDADPAVFDQDGD